MTTVVERWDSRAAQSGQKPTVELLYTVRGTDDDVAAHAALESSAPAFYRGLKRDHTAIEPLGPGTWKGTAQYAAIEPLEVDAPQFEFDTGGGSSKLSQSRETVASYAPPGLLAPNFGGAINATKDGVDGVDIDVPAMKGTIRVAVAPEAFDRTYIKTLAYMAKKVNDAPFYDWQPGEVRFDGGTVCRRGSDKVEVMLTFLISQNASGLTVGTIGGISKDGWDYLWVLYEDVEDAGAKMLVKRPRAVYVERVYERADFSALGVGS